MATEATREIDGTWGDGTFDWTMDSHEPFAQRFDQRSLSHQAGYSTLSPL